jgi:hypothetical protein
LTPRTVLARTVSLTASSPTYLRGRRSPSERRRFVTGWHVVRGRQRGAARQWAWPAVVVAMMIAGALVWLGTRQGVGASSDSAVYVSGARNLADGDEFVSFSLQPITTFPPGFPITLAAGDRLGVDPAEGARALDVVAFGALVLLTFLLARRHVGSPWLCVWTAAAVAFAPALLGVYTYAWSEPVFNVLVLAMLLIVEPLMVRRGRDPVLLFLAAVVAGVAFSYRYAGITVLALPAIVILASAWRDGFRALLARTSTYVGLAMVVPALVVARNLSDGAGVLGDRGTSDETLGGVAQDMMRTFHEWALRSESSLLGYVALAGAGVVMTFGLGIAVRRRTRGHRGEGAPLLPLVTYVVVYLGYITASELSTSLDRVASRLLSPIFAPSIVLGAIALQEVLGFDWGGRHGLRRWATAALSAALVLWLGVSLRSSVVAGRKDGERGQGYASRSWKASELAARVRGVPPRSRVFSNAAAGLYYVSGHQPVSSSPALRARRAPLSHAYLAWYAGSSDGAATPSELRDLGFSLCVVARTRDGTLYRVTIDKRNPRMDTLPACPATP